VLEREFEDILAAYPELIEENLTLEGRQVNVDRKLIDLLFKDRHGQHLIVELKAGVARREHIAQLLDYAGYKIEQKDAPVRIMLVAHRIPENFKHSFDYFGFEYKEITAPQLKSFIESKGDKRFLDMLTKELNKAKETEISTAPVVIAQAEPAVTRDRNKTRQNMAKRIAGGRMFNQARYAVELLEAKKGPVSMKEIILFMSSKGYHSKTYYDLFNSLVDSGLVEEVRISGKKAYQLKTD